MTVLHIIFLQFLSLSLLLFFSESSVRFSLCNGCSRTFFILMCVCVKRGAVEEKKKKTFH